MTSDNYWHEKRITLKDIAGAWVPVLVVFAIVLAVTVF